MKLSDQKCRNAKAQDKAYKMFDGGGLYLQVTKKGSKLWRLKYYFLNKEKKLSIGSYPDISLADAREWRKKAKSQLAKGIDPSTAKQEKREERIQENQNTFEIIAKEWHEMKLPEWSDGHAKTILRRLKKDVFPVIGSTPIKDITHKQLLDLAQSVQQRGANELAKRIIQMSRHIFQYAIITGRAENNIAEDLKGIIKKKKTEHFAAIEPHELPKFLHDLEANRHRLSWMTYLATKMMMLTFVRTSELIEAKWSEFDLQNKTWLIPAERMKMNKDHIVPLSEQVIEILNELRESHNHPDFVFPGRNSRKKHMSNNTILSAIKRIGYKGKMTGHGFRSLAMSTIMEKLHYRHEVPDAQLAHSKRGAVNKAYDRAKFLKERTKMMQEWADYMDELQVGGKVLEGRFRNG